MFHNSFLLSELYVADIFHGSRPMDWCQIYSQFRIKVHLKNTRLVTVLHWSDTAGFTNADTFNDSEQPYNWPGDN